MYALDLPWIPMSDDEEDPLDGPWLRERDADRRAETRAEQRRECARRAA